MLLIGAVAVAVAGTRSARRARIGDMVCVSAAETGVTRVQRTTNAAKEEDVKKRKTLTELYNGVEEEEEVAAAEESLAHAGAGGGW